MSNTIASNNGLAGISVQPMGSAVVTGVLSKVTANNNFNGIAVDSEATTGVSLNVTVVDSVASNNSNFGVVAVPRSGLATAVMLRNVIASYNGTGIFVEGTAILRVAHSVVTGNTTGVSTSSGGAIQSYGDTDIDGNANNNTGILTTIPPH